MSNRVPAQANLDGIDLISKHNTMEPSWNLEVNLGSHGTTRPASEVFATVIFTAFACLRVYDCSM